MPTYAYKCEGCGKQVDIFHKISDPPKKKCPSCGQNKLKRLVSAGIGIIFKGTGFYATDYKDR